MRNATLAATVIVITLFWSMVAAITASGMAARVIGMLGR